MWKTEYENIYLSPNTTLAWALFGLFGRYPGSTLIGIIRVPPEPGSMIGLGVIFVGWDTAGVGDIVGYCTTLLFWSRSPAMESVTAFPINQLNVRIKNGSNPFTIVDFFNGINQIAYLHHALMIPNFFRRKLSKETLPLRPSQTYKVWHSIVLVVIRFAYLLLSNWWMYQPVQPNIYFPFNN